MIWVSCGPVLFPAKKGYRVSFLLLAWRRPKGGRNFVAKNPSVSVGPPVLPCKQKEAQILLSWARVHFNHFPVEKSRDVCLSICSTYHNHESSVDDQPRRRFVFLAHCTSIFSWFVVGQRYGSREPRKVGFRSRFLTVVDLFLNIFPFSDLGRQPRNLRCVNRIFLKKFHALIDSPVFGTR